MSNDLGAPPTKIAGLVPAAFRFGGLGAASTVAHSDVVTASMASIAASVLGVRSTTAPVLATAGTITTAGVGLARVAPAGAVTGVILQPGTADPQRVTVVNESPGADSVTFAAAGTSNVANGASCVIPGLTAQSFVWDTATALWYPS